METIKIITSTIIGFFTAGIIGFIFFFKPKKKREHADADKAVHQSESVAIGNANAASQEWKKIADQYKKDYLEVKSDYKQILENQRTMKSELADIKKVNKDFLELFTSRCADCEYIDDKTRGEIKKQILAKLK